MADPFVDPALVLAWLTARSIARDLPAPVYDRGGFRVDANSEKEVRRWVFPSLSKGLSVIGREVSASRHFLKLCGGDDDLRNALPSNWELQSRSYFMSAGATSTQASPLPDGYQLEIHQTGPLTHVRVIAPDTSLAASGYAAEAADVFVYDRIETSPDHRRKGLGNAVMFALGAARRSHAAPQLLVATEDGRKLYTALGWTVLSPYATATIPGA
jgi:GNAT superfamily N-acetyltransferase